MKKRKSTLKKNKKTKKKVLIIETKKDVPTEIKEKAVKDAEMRRGPLVAQSARKRMIMEEIRKLKEEDLRER